MGRITLTGVGKHYGATQAVADLDLSVDHGEVVALLGPSGCGKSTTLRMIAGLEEVSAGEIAIDGKTVSRPGTSTPPHRRGLGMVFQNYAVWPHMTIDQNVAYPLRLGGLGRSECRAAVERTLELVGLHGLGGRLPSQLSGGQQQRVALARALVMEPRALLLDEPLSNLDAQLRERMRYEILELHRRLGLTILHVTHDQVEAMTLSDRIVVMRGGHVVQTGSPREIYTAPCTPFTAAFIGHANLLPAWLVARNGEEGSARVSFAGETTLDCDVAVTEAVLGCGAQGMLFSRPETTRIVSPECGIMSAEVTAVTFLGDAQEITLTTAAGEIRARVAPDTLARRGENVGVTFDSPRFLPDESEWP